MMFVAVTVLVVVAAVCCFIVRDRLEITVPVGWALNTNN